MIGNATIGCENTYRVCITDSCGQLICEIPARFICGGIMSNVLDDYGAAEIELTGKHKLWEKICLGRHYLEIKRNNIVEFKGPITRMESNPTLIVARTPLWWTRKRYRTPLDLADETYATPVQMFEGVILQPTDDPIIHPEFGGCDEAECGPDFRALCYESLWRLDGGEEAVAPTADPCDEDILLSDLLDDYADSFLDYTEIGCDLLYGYQQVPIPPDRQQARPVLGNNSWCEKPQIVRDLEEFATDVSVQTGASDTGSAPFTKNGNFHKRVCCTKYGYHQRIVEHEELDGVNEIEDAACGYLPKYCDDRDITYIANLNDTQLDPSVPWDTPRQVPGMLVDVVLDCEDQGVSINATMRLIERIIEFGPGIDASKVTLGPV